jgi:hypothetical protein
MSFNSIPSKGLLPALKARNWRNRSSNIFAASRDIKRNFTDAIFVPIFLAHPRALWDFCLSDWMLKFLWPEPTWRTHKKGIMAFYFCNLANPSRVKAASLSENPAIIAYAIRAFASLKFRRVDANFGPRTLLNPRHITRALAKKFPISLPTRRSIQHIRWNIVYLGKYSLMFSLAQISFSIHSAKTFWSSSKAISPHRLASCPELLQRFVDDNSSFDVSAFQMPRSRMGSDPVTQGSETLIESRQHICSHFWAMVT